MVSFITYSIGKSKRICPNDYNERFIYKYFGSNNLITESEILSLIKIDCCGADKVSARIIRAYGDIGYGGTNMTCCIARKGYNQDIKEEYDKAKANDECQGFVFVNVECKPVSSTLIRTHLLKLRGNLCKEIKHGNDKDNGIIWKLRKNLNTKKINKYKEEFRNGVKDIMHPDAIEYLIDNIDDLWLVSG